MRIKLVIVSVLVLIGQTLQAQIKQVINPISELEVTDRLWVSIVPSDKNEMIIDGELADKVEAVVSQDKIRLKMKAGYYLKGNQASVVIFTNQISTIIARKGAEVNVEKDTLKVNRVSLTANGGAKIRALISTSNLTVKINSGSTVDVLGVSENLTVNTTAGSSFFGKDLKTKNAVVRVNGGGRSQINADEFADVETRIGGEIEVFGNPKERKEKKIAGGKISFLD